MSRLYSSRRHGPRRDRCAHVRRVIKTKASAHPRVHGAFPAVARAAEACPRPHRMETVHSRSTAIRHAGVAQVAREARTLLRQTEDHGLGACGMEEHLSLNGQTSRIGHRLEQFSAVVTRWTGGSAAFGVAAATIVAWLASGPFFGFSDTWQLVINTGTTIVTFLMVFLIQRSQNKDALAIQLKLNELVGALDGASNRLIDVEDLSEEELHTLHRFYAELAKRAKHDATLTRSHSIEEARARADEKRRSHRRRPT
jgi:low affinity Fe/Cu permease